MNISFLGLGPSRQYIVFYVPMEFNYCVWERERESERERDRGRDIEREREKMLSEIYCMLSINGLQFFWERERERILSEIYCMLCINGVQFFWESERERKREKESTIWNILYASTIIVLERERKREIVLFEILNYHYTVVHLIVFNNIETGRDWNFVCSRYVQISKALNSFSMSALRRCIPNETNSHYSSVPQR